MFATVSQVPKMQVVDVSRSPTRATSRPTSDKPTESDAAADMRISAAMLLLAAGTYAQMPYVDGQTMVINMHGAGTTNPQRLFWEAMDLLTARAKLPTHMTYRAVGSSTGQREFNGDADSNYTAYNHFGAGDIPMTNSRYTSITGAGRTMVHVPFAMGAIGVFHSVPSSELGGAPIDLTGCLLARIFARDITNWDHPDIRALNPGMTASGAIRVYHRVRGSSSTAGFTQYLESKCPESWALGSGSTITWPADTIGAQGSGGMADAIAENAYAIGYIDAGHGHERGFGEIALQNLDGLYLTTQQANIAAAAGPALADGVIPADPTADFSQVNLYDQSGPTTWPITMISYFYLDRDLSSMDAYSASVLLYFIRFILSDEGQTLAEANMFSRLPSDLEIYNANTLASITLPAGFVLFGTELASTTQPWIGARDNVFSGKRRSWLDYQADSIETRLATLESPSAPPLPSDEDLTCISSFCFSEQDLAGIAVASLVVSIVSLLIGIIGLCVGLNAMKTQAMRPSTSTYKGPEITSASMTSSADGNGKHDAI